MKNMSIDLAKPGIGHEDRTVVFVDFFYPPLVWYAHFRWEGKKIGFVGRRCILVSGFQAEAQKKKDEAEVQVNLYTVEATGAETKSHLITPNYSSSDQEVLLQGNRRGRYSSSHKQMYYRRNKWNLCSKPVISKG